MDIKFVENLPKESGYTFKKGDTVADAEEIFGTAQTRYFLETGHAEPVKGKAEVAINRGKTETGDAK